MNIRGKEERGIIDIVLPAYNPHENWEQDVVTNFKKLGELFPKYDFRLFIATDGSSKGYTEHVTDYLTKNIPTINIVHYQQNVGKGHALRSAVKECHDDYVIYIDYDFPYTFHSIFNVIDALQDGADVVIASRSKQYQKNLPHIRKQLSNFSHFLNRFILGLPFSDTQGGMKGFNRRGRELFLQTTIKTFLFDTQFIYKSVKTGVRVDNVDAEIKPGMRVSVMGLKVMWREFGNIFEIKK